MELQALEMRLENLEKKMSEVHELTSILPRLEERMIAQKDDLQDHEVRLRTLEKTQARDNIHSAWGERIIGAVVTASILGAGTVIFSYVL